MKLHATFSYFVTRKPTVEQLNDVHPNHVYMLTPEEFDPHKSSDAQTEDHLVNYDGEVADARNRSKLFISDIEDDPTMTVCAMSNMRMEEQTLVDEFVLEERDADEGLLGQPFNVDLASISSIFCERTLSHRLSTRREVLKIHRHLDTYDPNPAYEVEFDDGTVRDYGATTIAENLLTQVDDDGYSNTMFKAIVDYKRDPKVAVSEEKCYVMSKNGQRRTRKTTKGWKLMLLWNDGTQSWIDLSVLKESNPVDVAEFAKAHHIDEEPAFRWWVPHTLRKRDMIISAVKARVRKTTHKYGIEIPTSVEHAKRLDAQNGNNLWMKALSKEMSNIGVAVEVLAYGVLALPGYSKVTGHLYAGVVSRESVRIACTYAALNNLDVFAADIRNAYLQAPSSRRDYIICGPEFRLENVGKVALIHRALYGGKTAGRDFRNHLRACMHHLHFLSCPADPNVWMRPAMKDDGSEYWEYVLLYTDDALCVSMNPERVLRKELGKYFELKEESIGPPKIYLGSNVRKVELDTGVQCWAFGSSQYVQAAVKNVERYLNDRSKAGDERFKLKPKAMTPMQTSFRPELDVSPELEPSDASYYQSLIEVLRWIVELGKVDICLECSLISSQLAMPKVEHLHQVLSIFSYLKSHHNAELDLSYNLKEELPPNQPEPKGIGFVTTAKVDADHASDTTTRRSRAGFFVSVNGALVYWMAKKQTAVESSSFGSEFCAMKLCCEYLRGLRYKLRMMGIPVLGPSFIYGDNKSVLANTSIPDSQLKKKSQSIAYHFIREGAAKDKWRTSYVNTHENDADLLTKKLPYGQKRRKFVNRLIHHVYEHN
ncbi:unnamed protein product [Cylindrotheca closterium]|uniref:Reverse transcriptase Ty1/copia-type domain-containing protein n=1 Tax=Cylindrotheca closterium TaxID=2856 RepID=A0AAD2G8E8_9STRA|nr:unnamed protein product [Cylindrotheca closterium]